MIIRVLDEKTINKIAAGEVVERPAAAIRELIQNSIDAQCTELFIELERGGKQLIRVRDNGLMTKDDGIRGMRHQRSFRQRLVFHHIAGIRGEAVPSIASVSRFELITRDKESEHATKIVVDGGNRISTSPSSGAIGTQHGAKSLLQRTGSSACEGTELSHAIEAIHRELLIRPHIDVEFGTIALLILPRETLSKRAEQILGNQAKGLISIDATLGKVRIRGAISPVGVHRSTGGNNSYLYVNDRFVKDTAVRRAIKEA